MGINDRKLQRALEQQAKGGYLTEKQRRMIDPSRPNEFEEGGEAVREYERQLAQDKLKQDALGSIAAWEQQINASKGGGISDKDISDVESAPAETPTPAPTPRPAPAKPAGGLDFSALAGMGGSRQAPAPAATGPTAYDMAKFSQVPEFQAYTAASSKQKASTSMRKAVDALKADETLANSPIVAMLEAAVETPEMAKLAEKLFAEIGTQTRQLTTGAQSGEQKMEQLDAQATQKAEQQQSKEEALKELEAMRQQNRMQLVSLREKAKATGGAVSGKGAAAKQRKPVSAEAAKTMGLLASGLKGATDLLDLMETDEVGLWDVTWAGQFSNPKAALAREQAVETLGRLNSGGAISEPEAKRFGRLIANPKLMATDEGRMAVADNLRDFIARANGTGNMIYGGTGWESAFEIADEAPAATPAPRTPIGPPAVTPGPTAPRGQRTPAPTITPSGPGTVPNTPIKYERDPVTGKLRRVQ